MELFRLDNWATHMGNINKCEQDPEIECVGVAKNMLI